MEKVEDKENAKTSKSKINTEDNLPPLGARGLDIQLRSEEVQEILTKVPHWMIRWGNALFLGLIILILFISWLIKYPDIIVAESVVTTVLPPQKEYAKTSGKFSAILVNDHDEVRADQPLAILENTANYLDVFTLKSIVDTIKVNNQNFEFPVDQIPVLFLGDIEAPFALFENSYIQYKINKDLQPFSNETTANKYAISELKSRLMSLQGQRDLNQTELQLKAKELDRSKKLFDKGVISAQEYDNQQLAYAQFERNFKNFETSISQLRENINNAQSNSKGTEINQVREEMLLLKSVIQSFNQLKKAIRDWEYQYVLRSNINGELSFLNYWNVNQTVNAGDLVFTVIPSANSAFVAKLKTPAQNSGKIKIGHKVNIRLESFPEAEFGTLNGTVINMSLIPDTEGFYLIDVAIPDNLVTSYNKTIEFKQEMRGTAEIITEDLRLVERFFYQFRDLLTRK